MAPTSDQYVLKVTAGPSYADQKPLSPNTEQPFTVSSSKLEAAITVRVQNYRGLPVHSPSTSPYFSHPLHKRDLYSLQFALTPKSDLDSGDLLLGNDFDHPIRDRLPPGFDHALKIVKWFIDPGLEGDVYADEPGLFGPLMSSINTFRFNGKGEPIVRAAANPGKGGEAAASAGEHKKAEGDEAGDHEAADLPYVVDEGADDGEASSARHDSGIPGDAAARKKYFLTAAHREGFKLESGRRYEFDFYNPYLDFNEFAVKLPGFSLIPGITIPVISYWDGQPLRYVLKSKKTNEPLFVVIFTLVPKDEAGKVAADGAGEGKAGDKSGRDGTNKEAGAAAPKPATETSQDDLD